MPANEETIKVLDAKINETQRLADEAQRWANRLGQLTNDLAVLKRARELLLSVEEPGEVRRELVHVWPPPLAESQSAMNPNAQPEAPGTAASNIAQPTSIGGLVVMVLTEADAPLSVQTILERVRAKGRADLNLKTLGGVISQYVSKGALRRTARATYALPLANGNREAMHAS
jgi:hypothetical protein